MSEFKFACPVCGQHITCDSDSAGTQMSCPTCFRKLVVPQAPVPGAKSFVLTAALVQERPATALENGKGSAAVTSAPAKRFPIVAIAIGVVLIGAAAGATIFFIAKKDEKSPPKPDSDGQSKAMVRVTNAVPKLVLPPAPVDTTNWTLNLAEAQIPDAPVSGAVHGFGFKLERAVIQGGKLDLRQGAKWPPDVGLSIHLFAERPEDLAGKTVLLESTRTNAPRVFLRWKNEDDKAQTKEYRKGYAARVEFGPATNNRLVGKIYLATPDEAKSYAAGTFSAEIRRPAPPKK